MSRHHKVAIIVDREFGASLVDLASQYHVWIVESSANTPVIHEVWSSEALDGDGDPLGPGVTAFQAGAEESPDEMCERIAYEVDDHHGEFGHDPPWTEIKVIGAALSPRLEEAVHDIGAARLCVTPNGFICRR